jgi:subtilisin family serine protease
LRVPAGVDLDAARAVVRGLDSGGDADFNHYFRSEEAAPAACAGMNCASLQLIGWTGSVEGSASPVCSAEVAIGIIDTGINPDHPTFSGKRLEVHRLSDAGLEPSRAVHGTAVTALLIGDAAGRAPGLLPGAAVIAVDAFHREGGDERADVFTLVRALDYLADRGVRVINLSLSGPPNSALEEAIDALTARNVVLVAAAGNGGPKAAPAYPAAYAPVIAVTAVDAGGEVYRRAGQGDHIDLAAPGVNVWTAASVSGEKPKTGTSFAAPFVTAAAAMILEAEPALTAAEVDARLKSSARDLGAAGSDAVFGAGLVQMPAPCSELPLSKAVDALGD